MKSGGNTLKVMHTQVVNYRVEIIAFCFDIHNKSIHQ